MFKDVKCTSSDVNVDSHSIRLAAATLHLLTNQSHFTGYRAVLRKNCLARIRRENTPLTPNSYICGIHFPAGHPDEESDSPSSFLAKLVISKCYSRVSTKGDFNATTSIPKPHSTADLSSKEDGSVVCSAMLTRSIDLEGARDEKIDELESIIKDQEKVTTGLENLLSESCAEVESLKGQVFCCQTLSCPCKFHFLHRFVSRII